MLLQWAKSMGERNISKMGGQIQLSLGLGFLCWECPHPNTLPYIRTIHLILYMGQVHVCEMFPKCKAGHSYHLSAVGFLFWECPSPKALPSYKIWPNCSLVFGGTLQSMVLPRSLRHATTLPFHVILLENKQVFYFLFV
jgi:hypothetical protein